MDNFIFDLQLFNTIENDQGNTTVSGSADDDIITNTGANATINGGDGNDSITNSGNSAGIYGGSSGNDYIENSGADATIDGGGGDDSISNKGVGTYINGSDGNDYIENSGAAAKIDGDDGDDSISNKGAWTYINGGDGSDSITNSGNNAWINGGSGNDYIENSGANATIYASAGNDTLVGIDSTTNIVTTATGASVDGSDVILTTSDGNFRITNGVGQSFLLNGNSTVISGEDSTDTTITNSVSDTVITGSKNADTISNTADNVTIDGGAGDDIVTNTGNNVSINAGDGNNLILGSGDSLTISAGAGNDTLSATDSSATLSGSSIDLGTGENVINYAGTLEKVLITGAATDINIGTLTSPVENGSYAFNTISLDGGAANNVSIENFSGAALAMYLNNTSDSDTNTISVSKVNGDKNILFASVNGAAASKLALGDVTGINNFFAVDFGPGDSNVYSNNDVVTVGDVGDSNEFHIWLDGGNDTITFGDFGENVSMGAVALETLTAVMGNVSDGGVIRFVGGYLNNITMGDLGNSVKVDINLQDGNDVVKIGNIGEGSVVTLIGGGGSDSIEFGTVQGTITVDSGDPKHRIFTDPQRHPEKTPVSSTSTAEINAIDLKIASIGANSNVEITGGADADNISIGGATDATLNITTGEGNDTIDLANAVNSQVTIDAGEGDNVVKLYHSYGNTITTGAGNDSISVSKGSSLNVYTGEGNDTITGKLGGLEDDDWSFGGYATIDAGAGDDYIAPFYTDNASIYGGDGSDTIITNGQNTTINGGAGNDYIELTNNYKESTGTVEPAVIITGEGDDSIKGVNSTTSIIAAATADKVDGSNVVLTTANGSVTLIDAVNNVLNIDGKNALFITKAGTYTLDGKTFELTEDAPNGVKVIFNDENKFEVSYIDKDTKTGTEYNYKKVVTVTGDTEYSVELTSTGMEKIKGLSNGANVSAIAYVDGSVDSLGTYFNLTTDQEGTFNVGTNSYTVTGDSEVTVLVAFDSIGSGKVSGISGLEGSISGNFTYNAEVNDDEFEVSEESANNLTIVADSNNATIKGLADGASVASKDGIAFEMVNTNLNANGVEYQLLGDTDGVTITGEVITGLDPDATLNIGKAGMYTVNGSALVAKSSEVTVLAVTDSYAYIVDASNPQFDSGSSTDDILNGYGVNSESVISSASEGTIVATANGAAAVVDANTTSETTVLLGSKGNLAVIESTTAPVTIVGGKGDDTVVTSGQDVTVDMANGGADKIIATGGKVTLDNYNAQNSEGGVKLTTEDIKKGAKFGDNGVELSNATVDPGSNFVNLYTPDDKKQAVGFATSDNNNLDYSNSKEDLVLIGGGDSLTNDVGDSTLKGGSGNDTISAGKGDYVDAGSGNNQVTMSDEGGSTLNFTAGKTTVDNFNFAGDGTGTVNADTIQTGNGGVQSVSVDSDAVIIATSRGTLKVDDAVNNNIALKNDWYEGVAQIGDDKLVVDDKADMYWAAGEDATISVGNLTDTDTTLAIKLDGSKQENTYRGDIKDIDASNFAGAVDLVGNDKGNAITASKGGSTLKGGKGDDTVTGGDGADEFVYATGDGKDLVKGFTFGTGETADSINTGNAAVTGAEVSGNDLILSFSDSNDKVTIEGAAGQNMQFVNDYASDGVIAQVADNSLTIDDTANLYWATGSNASIAVGNLTDTDTTLAIKLDGSEQANEYRGDSIKAIDASNFAGAADLAGNDMGNLIKASKGGSTLAGGKGKDTLEGGDGADEFVYAIGDGKDLVQNFTFGTGETADKINTGNAAVMGAEVDDNNNLILSFDDSGDKLTIAGGAGQNMQFVNDYASDGVIAQVADNSLTIDDTANLYWATGSNASISVGNLTDTDTTLAIKLDGSEQANEYRGDNIRAIDASNFAGTADLAGNDRNNLVKASQGGSTLAGGKGKDTLEGGDGADEFVYATGDGKDLVKGFTFGTGETADKINTGNAAVMGAEVDDNDNLILSFDDSGDKLTIAGGAGQNMQFVNDYASDGVVARVFDNTVSVDGTADMYWAAGKNATVTIGDLADTDTTLEIVLDDLSKETVYRGNIKAIDASNFEGKADIEGNYKNNVITASKGGSTLAGGEGNDILIGNDGADEFVYANGDGRDVVQNFTFGTGENADKIKTGNAAVTGAEVDDNNNLVLSFNDSGDKLTIEGGAGKDMQFVNDYAPEGVVAQVAKKSLEYDGTANLYWATGKNATLSINSTVSGDELSIYLDGSQGDIEYRGDIKVLDGSGFIGATELVGNSNDNSIVAGNYGSTLWGGSDSSNDTLIGGNGDDVFIYKAGNGNDVISNATSSDTVRLDDITLDMITSIDATDNSIKLNFSDGGNLSLDTNNGTAFSVDGVSYTYNNESKTLEHK